MPGDPRPGVLHGAVVADHERPVAGQGEQGVAGQLVEVATRVRRPRSRSCRVDDLEQPALHGGVGGDHVGDGLAVPDPPVLARPPRARRRGRPARRRARRRWPRRGSSAAHRLRAAHAARARGTAGPRATSARTARCRRRRRRGRASRPARVRCSSSRRRTVATKSSASRATAVRARVGVVRRLVGGLRARRGDPGDAEPRVVVVGVEVPVPLAARVPAPRRPDAVGDVEVAAERDDVGVAEGPRVGRRGTRAQQRRSVHEQVADAQPRRRRVLEPGSVAALRRPDPSRAGHPGGAAASSRPVRRANRATRSSRSGRNGWVAGPPRTSMTPCVDERSQDRGGPAPPPVLEGCAWRAWRRRPRPAPRHRRGRDVRRGPRRGCARTPARCGTRAGHRDRRAARRARESARGSGGRGGPRPRAGRASRPAGGRTWPRPGAATPRRRATRRGARSQGRWVCSTRQQVPTGLAHSRRATTTRSRESVDVPFVQDEVVRRQRGDQRSQVVGPRRVRLRQLRGDHGTVHRLPLDEPRTVAESEHRLDDEGARDQLAELLGVELVDVEGVERLLPRPTPGEKVSRFGVDRATQPPGLVTRAHSATNRGCSQMCSTTCRLTTASKVASGKGRVTRLPLTGATAGYVCRRCASVGRS